MATIAILDSGVGGLSIYQRVKVKSPANNYIFISDNEAYPYGDKPENELVKRVTSVVERIIELYKPDILVIACNTASTIVLPQLRSIYDIPIVGVVPAIKPGCKLSKSKHVGLIATPGTISRGYTDKLIEKFADGCEVSKLGSSKMVDLAEQKLYTGKFDLAALELELKSMLEQNSIDVLILACTHYPFINKEISDLFNANNHDVRLIDSGHSIAERVASLLIDVVSEEQETYYSKAVFTKEIKHQNYFISNLKSLGLDSVNNLDI